MRKLYIFLFAAFCLTALSFGAKADPLCSSITGNLVTNCGFETGDFTGWTLSGNDVPGELGNLYGVEGQDPFDGIFPHSGSNQAFVGDLVSNALTLSQSINLTGPYDDYTVSFYLAQDTVPTTEYGNELKVVFGGTTYINLSDVAVEGYTKYSFTAPDSGTAQLSITLANGLGEFLLDDVSVVSTPEPSAWFLLLTAGALCVFGARSRFRQKSVI